MRIVENDIITMLKEKVRQIEDFPKPGIGFKDITPLLADPTSFAFYIDNLVQHYIGKGITKVCGIEARGFIGGSILAYKLNAGFIPIRKKGKLPFDTHEVSYGLEYGKDCLEIHVDAINEDDIILVHDDVLATGGTIDAAIQLIRKNNQNKIYADFMLELTFLKGRSKITDSMTETNSLISY